MAKKQYQLWTCPRCGRKNRLTGKITNVIMPMFNVDAEQKPCSCGLDRFSKAYYEAVAAKKINLKPA